MTVNEDVIGVMNASDLRVNACRDHCDDCESKICESASGGREC
jgi:hypothetical protein